MNTDFFDGTSLGNVVHPRGLIDHVDECLPNAANHFERLQ